jgi:hypothetical protein
VANQHYNGDEGVKPGGRRDGTYGERAKPGPKPKPTVADVDQAIENAAWVLDREMQRVRWAQAKDARCSEIHALDGNELEGVTRTLRALCETAAQIDEAKSRLKLKAEDLTDVELYERMLARAKELGKKLGRPDLVEKT